MSTNIVPIFPPKKARCDLQPWSEDYADYLKDESKLSAQEAKGIAFPKSIEELSGFIAETALRKLPITISAARTGITGGAVPDEQSVIISLDKLKGSSEPRKNEAGDYEIEFFAGTSLQELAETVSDKLPSFYFPVNPTEQSASIGGAAALNAGGSRSLKFGSVRGWVNGLQIVLADGSLIKAHRGDYRAKDGEFKFVTDQGEKLLVQKQIPKPLTKNTIGYSFDNEIDLIDLFVGSEGTLGIIAAVTVRLEKVPRLRLSHLQAFASAKTALDLVDELRALPQLKPLALEFMDGRAVSYRTKTADKFSQLVKGSDAVLFIEVAADSSEELEEFSIALIEKLAALGEDAERSLSGMDDKTLSEIAAFRHSIPEAVNALVATRRVKVPALHKVATDMAVPDDQLAWVYALYETELTKRGFEFCIFGHAGNNHFHVNILPRDEADLERAKETYLELAKQIVAHGGSVAAEHGIGRLKRHLLEIQYSKEVLQQFTQIKNFFDPEKRLNRHLLAVNSK